MIVEGRSLAEITPAR